MSSHLLRLAARSTLRHPARTLLTAGMVTLSVALQTISLAWIGGIFGQMLAEATAMSGHVRIVHPRFAAREQLNPLYENLQPVAPLVDALRTRPGVTAVQPRISAGVTVTVGEEIGEVFAMAIGAPHSYYVERLRALERLDQGRWFTGPEELVMGYRVARQTGAAIGDQVVLLGMTQDGALSPLKGTLVGILRGGNSFFDQQVFLPLEQLQWLTDIPGGATEVLVFGERYQQAAKLAENLRHLPELEGLAVQPWSVRQPWAGILQTIGAIQGILVFFIVFLAALGIWNTMMMSVLERTGEIGTLRAMGLGRLGVVGLFVFEAVVIAIVGGLAGVLLGSGPAWLIETRGVHLGDRLTANFSADLPFSATVYGDLTAGILVGAFLLGLLTAVLGSVIPALRAASIQPVIAMQAKR